LFIQGTIIHVKYRKLNTHAPHSPQRADGLVGAAERNARLRRARSVELCDGGVWRAHDDSRRGGVRGESGRRNGVAVDAIVGRGIGYMRGLSHSKYFGDNESLCDVRGFRR
jgi:hypothetical protein